MSLDTSDQSIETQVAADPRRWLSIVVVLTATFLGILNTFIVNVAVPTIQQSLHASFSEAQLIITGYTLTYAVLLTTGGRLGDLYGRKRLFLIGISSFTLTSALCGMAPNPLLLILFRGLQGGSAALMIPQVLSIIQISLQPSERGTAFGLYGATAGLAAILGPVVGGLLIHANVLGLGWRAIFYVNVLLGIGAAGAALLLLRESRASLAGGFDFFGVIIVSVGLLLLTYPLIVGPRMGWPLWIDLFLLCSLPVLAIFVLYEQRLTRHGRIPLVTISLFLQRAFVVGILIVLFLYGGSAAFFLVLAYYVQSGLGLSALTVGFAFLALGLGFVLASATAPRLMPKLGRNVLTLGAIFMLVGYLLLIILVQQAVASPGFYSLLPALFIEGLGQGIVTAPLITAVLAGIPNRDVGAASGTLTTVQQISNTLGVALIGIVFFAALGNHANYAFAFIASLFVMLGQSLAIFLLVFFLPRHQ
jgi:EmrB/QacA subfamily drug resistance transporter